MHPDLIKLGGITIHTYGVMVLVAIAVGFVLSIATAARLKLDVGAVMVTAGVFLGGLIFGSKLGFIFEVRSEGTTSMLGGGLVLGYGLVLGLLLALPIPLFFKQHVGAVFDALAPPLLVALALGRLACFFAGCCYGKPTDLPWAVHFPYLPPEFGSLGAHPTQLYLLFALGICGAITFTVVGSLAFRGQLALITAAAFCAVTLSEKLLRYASQPPALWPRVVYGAVLIASLVLVFAIRPRRAISTESVGA